MIEEERIVQFCTCGHEWCLCMEHTFMTLAEITEAEARSGQPGTTWTCPSCVAGNWVMSMGALPVPYDTTRLN